MNTFFGLIESALRKNDIDAPIAREPMSEIVTSETVETKIGTWIDDDRLHRVNVMLDVARGKHKLDSRNTAYLVGTMRLKPHSAKEHELMRLMRPIIVEIVTHISTPDKIDTLFAEIGSAFRESVDLELDYQCLRLMVYSSERQSQLLAPGNVLVHKAESYAAQALSADVDVCRRRKMCACFCMATWFLTPHAQMRMIPHIDALVREDALEDFLAAFLACLVHMIEIQQLCGVSFAACFRLVDMDVVRDRCVKMNDDGQAMTYYALFTNKSPRNRDVFRKQTFHTEVFVVNN